MNRFDFEELRLCVKRVVTLHPYFVHNDNTAQESEPIAGAPPPKSPQQVAVFAEDLVTAIISVLSIGLVPGLTLWNCATCLEKCGESHPENISLFRYATSVVFQVRTQHASATSQQRTRAFVRCALNENCLLACLELLTEQEEALRTCYVDGALLRSRQDHCWEEFVTSIAPVAGPPLEARLHLDSAQVRSMSFLTFRLRLYLPTDTSRRIETGPANTPSSFGSTEGPPTIEIVRASKRGKLAGLRCSPRGSSVADGVSADAMTEDRTTVSGTSSRDKSQRRHRRHRHRDGSEDGEKKEKRRHRHRKESRRGLDSPVSASAVNDASLDAADECQHPISPEPALSRAEILFREVLQFAPNKSCEGPRMCYRECPRVSREILKNSDETMGKFRQLMADTLSDREPVSYCGSREIESNVDTLLEGYERLLCVRVAWVESRRCAAECGLMELHDVDASTIDC